MTEKEFDTMLRAALLEARRRELEPVLSGGPELIWTPRRQRVMDRILADPFGYGKRRARPVWRRTLGRVGQAAACLLLAGSLAYVTVPAARAWVDSVIRMVVEWTAANTRFRFQGEAQGELGDWRPTYLPEGYEEVDVLQRETMCRVTYGNESGDEFEFEYMSVEDGARFNFDNEHSNYSEIEQNGQPAHLFTSNTEGKPSYLVWFDETGTTTYFLMADIPIEEFLMVAESVAPQ